jgi:hypothetical protein
VKKKERPEPNIPERLNCSWKIKQIKDVYSPNSGLEKFLHYDLVASTFRDPSPHVQENQKITGKSNYF